MSSQEAEETEVTTGAPEEAPPSEGTVAAYLEADPDFFTRHPGLTARLRVPHGPAGSVSLIEHQVSLLRAQLETERHRLSHLIARAREYETLSARLHALVLQLIAAPDLARVEAVLRESLCRDLDAEALSLKLFSVGAEADAADPLVGAFRDFVDGEHALCGPLDAERNGALFGRLSEKIQSAALIPIRGEPRSGVLAIGSSDPERFAPQMGTEHLDRLGEVVSQKLRALDQVDG
jgi:uncharacterized protein YigA (DUF484 family)